MDNTNKWFVQKVYMKPDIMKPVCEVYRIRLYTSALEPNIQYRLPAWMEPL